MNISSWGKSAKVVPGKRKKTKKPSRRAGAITKTEKMIVSQLVADSPAEMTPKQVITLAQTLRRSPTVIRTLIEDARDNFNADAEFYASTHKKVVEKALEVGDSKSLEVARKGAAWAMTNIAHEGKRVIDRPEAGPQGSKILIGIRIGGVKEQTIEALPLLEGGVTETDV